MRFRATLACLLAVILLSFSSFVSACDIHCDRASQAASCHSGMKHGPHQTSAPMSSMPGMDTNSADEAAPHLACLRNTADLLSSCLRSAAGIVAFADSSICEYGPRSLLKK
jgi:hypothetical protein